MFTLPEYLHRRHGRGRIRVYLSCVQLVLYILSKLVVISTHTLHTVGWLVAYCFMSSSKILHSYRDWLIDYIVFYALSAIFRPCNGGHSYRDLTVTGDGLQNSGLWLALEAFVHLNREGSLSCYTCCDAGKQRILRTDSNTDLYIQWNKSHFYGKLIILAYPQLYRQYDIQYNIVCLYKKAYCDHKKIVKRLLELDTYTCSVIIMRDD